MFIAVAHMVVVSILLQTKEKKFPEVWIFISFGPILTVILASFIIKKVQMTCFVKAFVTFLGALFIAIGTDNLGLH